MQLRFSIVRSPAFVLLAVALQLLLSETVIRASDTNVFLVRNNLQGAGYTVKGVRPVRVRGNLLLGDDAINGNVLAIAVHHMEYVLDPTLRPVFRLVVYNPATQRIVAPLVEFTELEHVFNRNNHLIMHAYGSGLSGVDSASLDVMIDLTYQASATPAIPATPLRVSIQPLGTVKPTGPALANSPLTRDDGTILFQIPTDDPENQQYLQVDATGNGTGPSAGCNVSLSTKAIDFGTVTLGTPHVQPLVLRNNGLVACTVSEILVNGGSAFSVIAPHLTPFTLAAGASTNLLVQYAPVANVSDSAILRVSSTDPNNPQQYVTLTGFTTTAPANITASPESLNFGSVQVGTNQTLNVTIINSGGSTGIVTALSVAPSTIFTVSALAPFTIQPGATQSVAVTYRPVDTSSATGTLQVQVTGAGAHTVTIGLNGTGRTPVGALDIGSTSLDFGAVTNGGTRTVLLSVTNNSLAVCSISSIAYSGSSNFTNLLTSALPIILAPGAATDLVFRFKPTGGLVTGTATIFDSVAGPAPVVSLTGLGVPLSAGRAINISRVSLPFADVAVGSSNTLKFVVSNIGTSNCNVTTLGTTGGDFLPINIDPSVTNTPLAPGSSFGVAVQYSPSGVGADVGSAFIINDGTTNLVALTGNGVDPSVGLSTTNLQFGQWPAGSHVTLTNLVVKNTGGVNATIYSITLRGSPNFALDPIVPHSRFELTNEASVTIPVAYVAPSYPSTDVGAVVISNNVPGSELVVTLSATGLQSVLSVSPTDLTFGAVPVGSTGSVAVTIYNTGNTNGTIEAVEVNGSARYVPSLLGGITIGPGSSTNLNIEYIPAKVQTIVILGGGVTSAGKPIKVSP